MECNVYTIDGKEYVEVDTIVIDSSTYIFLSNEDNIEDFCIRKVVLVDGTEFLEGLQDNEEFDKVMMEFVKKHETEITSI